MGLRNVAAMRPCYSAPPFAMALRDSLLALPLGGVLILGAAAPARADESWRQPLGSRNQFPPALLFLSLDPERAIVLDRGESRLSFNLGYSNIIVLDESPGESLVLDLESLRSVFQWEVGLGRGFQVQAALPVFYMSGGFLDGFISEFHETLGIANSVRKETPNGLFRYRYRLDGELVIDRQDNVLAPGDLTFSVKKAIKTTGGNELALRAALKLPTGSFQRVTGSGAADFGFGLAASRVGRRVGGYLNLSYHLLGDPERAKARNYLSLVGAVDFPIRQNLALVLQVDHFRPFLESRLPVLDQGALQAVVGLRYRRGERFSYEWRFTEDLSETSPDFTFGFQLSVDLKTKNSGNGS